MQHDRLRIGPGLVDQMGRPQHGQALLGAQPADMLQQEAAAFHVEPDRRLIEQQQRRIMDQRAGDFDAPPLPAGQVPGPVLAARQKPDPIEFDRDARRRGRPRHAMERSVVE